MFIATPLCLLHTNYSSHEHVLIINMDGLARKEGRREREREEGRIVRLRGGKVGEGER